MKKYYFLVGFFMFLATNSLSQKTLSDYSYVIVSEQFEFQKEKDKYQLNSLTKFLFNKYGFNAYFDKEVPKYLDRCDGLYADAEGTPGFIITKVEVVISDCNGKELFRSDIGKSKVKDYKKAYYESMREAFISVEDLNVNQKEINTYEAENVVDDVKTNIVKPTKVIIAPAVTKEVVSEQPKETSSNAYETNILENIPTAKFSSYSYAGKTFLLRKTKEGYSFYEETNNNDDDLLLKGKLLISNFKLTFISTEKDSYDAQFDASKNLIINKNDATIVYKLMH